MVKTVSNSFKKDLEKINVRTSGFTFPSKRLYLVNQVTNY